MSTAAPEAAATARPATERPAEEAVSRVRRPRLRAGGLLFHTGDRLRQPEFHRLYEQMPGVKADLIGGIVYMASPDSDPHAEDHSLMTTWTGVYAARVAWLTSLDNATFIASLDDEVQPDAAIALHPDHGGRSHVNDRNIREGVGELFVEVAYSSASYDLYEKFELYRREGVREYVVVEVKDRRTRWFTLENGGYAEAEPEGGVFRSTQFPGLWLHAEGAAAPDAGAVLDSLAEGMATDAFKAYVETPPSG